MEDLEEIAQDACCMPVQVCHRTVGVQQLFRHLLREEELNISPETLLPCDINSTKNNIYIYIYILYISTAQKHFSRKRQPLPLSDAHILGTFCRVVNFGVYTTASVVGLSRVPPKTGNGYVLNRLVPCSCCLWLYEPATKAKFSTIHTCTCS